MGYNRLVHGIAQSTGASTGATTPARDTTGANLIVLVTSSDHSGASVSDSQSNTWTGLNVTAGSPAVQIWYCFNPSTSTTHTFSVSGASQYASIFARAYSGAATSPFDQQSTGVHQASGSTIQTGSATPGQNGELIIAALGTDAPSFGTLSIDSSFSIVDQAAFVGAAAYSLAVADFVQTTAAAVNPTWTMGNSPPASAIIATFKAAAGNSYTLVAAAGTFTLAGKNAGLYKGYKLNAAAGSFSLSGQAASFLRTLRLTAATGIFALTGRSASLIYSGKKLRFSQLTTPDYTVGAMNRAPFADRAPGIRLFGALGPIVAVSPGVYELTDVGTPAAALVSDGQGNYDITDASPSGTGRLVVHTSGIGDIF